MSAALFPILDRDAERKPLVGIARLAAQGEHVRDGHNVEYLTLPVRSLLNKCDSPRMPFTWTVNPYRGCEFACKYCYARYTHEFMELRDPLDFEQRIFIKQQAAALLRRDLGKIKRGESIAIGTATDPYQPAERRAEITRAVLEELALHRGLDIGIVTKSNLVVRDIDVLRRVAQHNALWVNLTVTTTDAELARILEPRAPRPDLRLDAIRQLNTAGIPAGAGCAPIIPGITDPPKALEAVVRAVAEAGGRWIFSNALFLKPCSAAVFLPFLEEKFPHLVADYRRRYAGRAFLDQAYRKRISALMHMLRRKYSIAAREDEIERVSAGYEAAAEQQMSLF
ncbi:MAG TPA: radical SAM protein [Terriglobales bacterium]|nr:radical SAM protein [Terriglobales bacterium]